MKRKIELLAPGGDIDSIKAAIAAGADAVYCGLKPFNARNRATNIDRQDLNGVINLAHKHNCRIFLTLNILIVGSEIPALVRLLNKLANTGIDGLIVQDLGLFYLLSKYFKSFNVHASTQLTTHNKGQINFLNKLKVTRINLSRELNLDEIKALTLTGHQHNILTEVFVHGSLCLSFSGICYMSSVLGGTSGNRGRCSQPCRDRYLPTPEGKNFPLNLKDNSAYSDLSDLYAAGVDSLKIEGRIKKFEYVYTVVNCWKKQLTRFYNQHRLNNDNSDLYKVFNRDFSNAYLKGEITKDMFIDNPRDNSLKHFSNINSHSTKKERGSAPLKFYDEKKAITATIKDKIKPLDIGKTPLTISISGRLNTPLTVSVETCGTSFRVLSKMNLAPKKKENPEKGLTYRFLTERLIAVTNTEYYIQHLEIKNLEEGLFIPFNEITSMKNRLLFILNGSKKKIHQIDVPLLKKKRSSNIKPALAVLISSQKDLDFCNRTTANIFFQLPDSLKNCCSEMVDFFLKNKRIIPWFPPVLIGKDYTAAKKFLGQVQPGRLVTNNTGIAYEAYEKGIPWIAGPYLNIVNSFSLLCLKERFNCSGSFISNELSKHQIKRIISPPDFKLYYSIYHPILLLTSRQCLLHQVSGCGKTAIDEECIQTCNRSSSITNLKKNALFIEKTRGNYHCIYNYSNFLNTDIVTDLPDMFSRFCIDLRDIKTGTSLEMDKSGIIDLFENLLDENTGAVKELKRLIHPSTDTQYKKGI